MKYTVFYEQVNRTNVQVEAKSPEEARVKADRIYAKRFAFPCSYVQDGWVLDSDGEDKS